MPRKPFIQMLKYPIATKHDRNILSLAMIGKLSYGGLFISIKVFNQKRALIFSKALKCSANKAVNKYLQRPVNAVHMLDAGNHEILFFGRRRPAF